MSKALIKRYYKKGLFSEADLDSFVAAGYITENEKAEIISQ